MGTDSKRVLLHIGVNWQDPGFSWTEFDVCDILHMRLETRQTRHGITLYKIY